MSTNKAKVSIQVKSGTIAQKQIHIQGAYSGTGDLTDPIRFGLMNRYTRDWVMKIDTFNSTFNNVFFEVPEGSYYLIAWRDSNWDWMVDSDEPKSAASNLTQTYLYDSSMAVSYFDVNANTPDVLEAQVDVYEGYDYTGNIFTSVSVAEAAFGTAYVLELEALHEAVPETNNQSGAYSKIQLTVYDDWSNIIKQSTATIALDASAHVFVNDVFANQEPNQLSYNPTWVGQDWAYIQLDLNNDGFGFGTDRAAWVPIYLEAEMSAARITVGNGDWFDEYY